MDQEIEITIRLTLSADCMHSKADLLDFMAAQAGAIQSQLIGSGITTERVQILNIREEREIYSNE